MRFSLVSLAACGLIPLYLLAGQTKPQAEQKREAAHATDESRANYRMYEDIEVMRFILNRTLINLASNSAHARSEAAHRSMGWSGLGMIGSGGLGPATEPPGMGAPPGARGPGPTDPLTGAGAGMGMGPGMSGMGTGSMAMSGMAISGGVSVPAEMLGTWTQPGWDPATEGYYLKGYGIVLHASLPHGLFAASGAIRVQEPRRAPVRVWEQVRKELSGEKRPDDGSREPETTTIEEWMLRLLAENGHNFSELGDDERVTVLLSFRKDDPRLAGMAAGLGVSMGEMAPMDSTGTPRGLSGFGAFGSGGGYAGALMGAGDSFIAPSQAESSNYELLGDLHMKQGRVREAAHAFQSAIATNPSLEIYTKLAQARLAYGDADGARQALADAAKHLGGSGQTRRDGASDRTVPKGDSEPAFQLPRKLILSAPKKLLDQVGSGKISFDEFKQAALVQSI